MEPASASFAFFLLPETKGLTLEELDSVFEVRNRDHAGYYAKKLPWYLKKKIMRGDVDHFPPLYDFASEVPSVGEKKSTASAYHNEGPLSSPTVGDKV